jgi:hypothetical protein
MAGKSPARKYAEKINDNWCYIIHISIYDSDAICIFCKSKAGSKDRIVHAKDCIVLEAQEYMKGEIKWKNAT